MADEDTNKKDERGNLDQVQDGNVTEETQEVSGTQEENTENTGENSEEQIEQTTGGDAPVEEQPADSTSQAFEAVSPQAESAPLNDGEPTEETALITEEDAKDLQTTVTNVESSEAKIDYTREIEGASVPVVKDLAAIEGQGATDGAEESKSDDDVISGDSTKDLTEEEKAILLASEAGKWYVIHTFAGHENKVKTTLEQRIEAEHLEHKIFQILVPTQDKIEIRGGKKETVKEKIFPGYILIKMILDDTTWLTVRTTQGVTSFIGVGNKPIPISDAEVSSIVKFTTQGAQPTFKDVFMVDDTVKIIDGPFADFIGKVDSVDKEKGRVRVLVSIFGRETPVELDFLQVQKL